MKEQEIIDSNILIAEFLGSKFINDAPEDYPNGYYYQPEGMEDDCPTGIPENWLFNVDWNWLMPVVEKIEGLNYGVLIYNDHTCISTYNDWFKCNPEICGDRYVDISQFEICNRSGSKIEMTFKAVVKFIKWYNQNKK
jgi:hypothetical protein